MPSASSSLTAAPPPAIDDVTRELARAPWDLRFSPAVEARFEADSGRRRARDLVVAGLVALLVYDLFLINDYSTRPEVLSIALFWRVAVMSGYGLAVLAAVRRGLPPALREFAMASTMVVAMGAAGMIFLATESPAREYDPFAFSLVFLAGNIAFPLRFVPAVLSSLIGVATAMGFVFAAPFLPTEARPWVVSLLLGAAVFTVLACYRIEQGTRRAYLLVLREELRSAAAVRAADEYAALSYTDPLTQIPNRRAFDRALSARWLAAAEHDEPVALLLVDIDHFKRFNDRYGHPAGDACLQRVAAALRDAVRVEDLVARMGGEEFGAVLIDGSLEAAELAAERLRRAVQDLSILHDGVDGQAVVTVSVGVGLATPSIGGGFALLVKAADEALYTAKRRGRNCWHTAVAAPPEARRSTASRAGHDR